ncbi:hypothetical protein ABPG72_004151 [Tetrahymena utriculariae]
MLGYTILQYFLVIIIFALQNCSSQLIRQENEIIQNCLNFSTNKSQQNNSNQSYCNICQYGYFLYQGKCFFIKNCEVSAIKYDQYLVQCLDGQYLTFYSNQFHACPANCNQCSFDNGLLLCTSCQQGYQLMQQLSPEGILHGTYCTIYSDANCVLQGECSINECCLKCKKGYFLDKQTQLCTSCSKIVNNCIDCIDVSAATDQISQVLCTACSMGFYQQFQYDQCNQCQTYCEVCAYQLVYFFNPIKMTFGNEKRLQCLQCQDGYGFHQDGQRCVKCENNCALCYKQLNNMYQYTLTSQFKAQLIGDKTMNFSLKCLNQEFQYYCIDVYGRLSKIQKQSIENCLLHYCGSVLDSKNIQTSYLSCLKCAKGYQPILKAYQTYITQECIDDCPSQCLTCIKDLSTNLNTCLNCQQEGKATDSNYLFFLNILSKIPDYQNIQQLIFPLFKVQYNNQSQKIRCLNCYVGCLVCQSIDNGISQIDLTVSEKDILINNFRIFFNENSFALPQLDTILTSRQICLKCDDGYQMVYPEQKCIKCSQGKQCKYQLQLQDEVIYFTQQLSIKAQLDDFMQNRINYAFSFYLVHQFNIQQISQVIRIQQGYYLLNNITSVNYNFLRNTYSKQIQQANLTIIGEEQGTTVFNISSYLSILDFENVRFENIMISLSKQGRLMIGNIKNFKSLIFKNVHFSNFEGCESGSLMIFSNIQKLKFINCTFNKIILNQDDFIQFIQQPFFSSTNEPVKNKILINNCNFIDCYFDRCFLNTYFLNKHYLDLQILNSIFDQVTTKCFISVQINDSNLENSIDYMNRKVTLLNNQFKIMIRNEGFFFMDETLDYIIMIGNTIKLQDYESYYTSQSTGFIFQQGLIKNTLIDSYRVQLDNLVLFDLSGLQKYNQMLDQCLDNIIRIVDFTIKSVLMIQITSPIVIIQPSMSNRLKSVYLENIFIYHITRTERQPYYIFDLQGLLVISLKNFICQDTFTEGQYLKLAAKVVKISQIKISLVHQSYSLFKIYSQQVFINNIRISNDFELQMSNIINFQQANYLNFEYADQIKGFTYENCINYTSCYTNKQNYLCYQELHSMQNSIQFLEQFTLNQEVLEDNIIFYKEKGIAQVIIWDIQIFQAIISSNIISITCFYQPVFISISKINFKQSEFILNNNQINFDEQQQFLLFIYAEQSLVSLVDINFQRFNSINMLDTSDKKNEQGEGGPSSSFQNKIQSLIFIDSEIINIQNIIANTPLLTNHSILRPHQFSVQESKFLQFTARTFILKDSIFNDFSCSKGGLLISPIQLNIDLYMKNVTLKKVNSEGDGGVLYFYLIESSIININFQSCIFDNISKDQGGIIAIDSSNDEVNIRIYDTIMKNIFSKQNTLISISQQGFTSIYLKNITIKEDQNQINQRLIKKSMLQIKYGLIEFIDLVIDSISNYDLVFIFDNSAISFYNVTLNQVSTHSGVVRVKFSQSLQFVNTTFQNVKRLSTQVTIESNIDEILRQAFGFCNPDFYFFMVETIFFENVMFDKNQVLPCGESFVNIQNSNFFFENVTIKNNYCDSVDFYNQEYSFMQIAGEHYMISQYGNLIINSQIYQNHLYGYSFGVINLSNLRVFVVNSTFHENFASYGGAIYFQQRGPTIVSNQNSQKINHYYNSYQEQYDTFIGDNYQFIAKYKFKYELIVDQCTFFKNNATEGGALYLDNQRGTKISLQFTILNSTFIQNNAVQNSPAISCLKYIPSVLNVLYQNNTLGSNKEVNPLNIAPSQISVSNTTNEDINFFSNFISGVEIESNMTFKFKDLSNQTVFLNKKNTDLIPYVFLSYETNKIALENYDLTTGQLVLGNISFIYQPGKNATFSLTSKHIITPILDENQIVTSFSNDEYIKYIIVEFRNCTLGEIYLPQKRICQLCPSGSYSRQGKQNSDVCLTCPEGAECPGGNVLNTIDGYWQDSSTEGEEKQILKCLYSQSNCLSNSNSSYQNITDPLQKQYFPCRLGHVGALCQSCDTQQLMSNVTFYEDGLYQCSSCSNKVSLYIKVGFVITGGLVLALLTVYSIIAEAQNKIIKNTLKLFGILSLGTASQYSPASSSLFKILINHSQINLIAFSLSQDIPQQLTQIINTIISPFRLIQTGFDCLFSQHFVEKLVFIKTIFFSLQPIIFYVLIMVCFTIIEVIRKKVIKSYYFYTSCFFVALYLIPQVIQQLILAISCQTVGQHKYMIADMTIVCFSKIHVQYIKYIIIPGLIVYGVLIPILMITLLCINKKHFTSSYFEIKYGFLYKEFKPNLFYWEILRLLFKVFIYSFIGLWQSEAQTKGLISILILILYFELFQKLKPFKNFDINMLELTSIQINIISLTLVVFAYQISNIGFQFFVYMVIIGLNFYFFYQVAKQLYKINKKQINYFKNQLTTLVKKMGMYCFQRICSIKKEVNDTKKNLPQDLTQITIQKNNWKILRDYFKLYTIVKQEQKNDTLSFFSLEIIKQYQIQKLLVNNKEKLYGLNNVEGKQLIADLKKQQSAKLDSVEKQKLCQSLFSFRSADQLVQDNSNIDFVVNTQLKTKSFSTEFSEEHHKIF